jgi:chromosome segregation protein
MLKALELVGFKSFADKTRFEFPRGITAVVGPNGSGKSNVVDAIKWVLGEQSVKSLRGKEMADVIFNGSSSRPPLHTAETTLTFDNSKRLLALDTPEVHITRRVYRSGEGEYLINRQPCRLRDIRELFSGTGVATEAYSVIEQGKVDVMLQSSPRERRLIFEEAAGISRFKAKKIESMRRLERVEQNLLRLSDIVNEVESRLRSVRLQATKARRYKEHADRLQELRTQVGLADWRSMSEKLAAVDAETSRIALERDGHIAEAERLEAEVLQLESLLGDTVESIRECEGRAAQTRERIASSEATVSHHRARMRDLEDEVARTRKQIASMGLRAGDLRQQLQETLDSLAAAEAQHETILGRLNHDEAELAELNDQLEQLRLAGDRIRAATMADARLTAALASEISALESQLETARQARQRGEQRLSELATSQADLEAQLEQLREQQQELQQREAEQQAQLAQARARADELRQRHTSRLADLNQLRQRFSGASERAAVLEELEHRLEGLNAGVKEIVLSARRAKAGPLQDVRGLVADLMRANVETAPLIDVALGDRAQHVVVAASEQILSYLQKESFKFKGRVGFIRLEMIPAADESAPDLTGLAGVLGRADRFMETAPELLPLARHLLGNTWLVENLTHALDLARHAPRASFVTLAGELLGSDRTISAGPRQAAVGLISRRSELRALKQLITELDISVTQSTAAVLQLEQQLTAETKRVETLSIEYQKTSQQLSEQQMRLKSEEGRLAQLGEQHATLAGEMTAADRQLESILQKLETTRQTLQAGEARLVECETETATIKAQIAELKEQRQSRDQTATAAKVELAKSEERLGNLRARQLQFERDQQERQRAITDSRDLLGQSCQRLQASQATILTAESLIAELYLLKEQLHAETIGKVAQRETQREQRAQRATLAQRARSAARKLEDQQHAKELEAHEIRHQRGALADRLREDYGIELSQLEQQPTAEEAHQREAVEQEIADLRRKLNQIGNVNLDALDELNELESRFASLSTQFEDLTKAKSLLEQIISKINADSRRLFSETLETVKTHFQGLFRKLFGGGQADIVLEEGVDILDSGIEVIARPPGKEPRNISLLSGGEKTLTCVALLLAIFQYRPSPFCVLDEVDAALDEANIERFIGVLQEFLAWTQFIVVTHSKKTMTCATTLYGVTMQESGVSKRVAVRFEDVSEQGEIRLSEEAAAAPSAAKSSSDDETQAA